MNYSLTVLVFAILTSTHLSVGQVALPSYDEPEGYAVYSAALKDSWAVRIAKAKRLVIMTETTVYPRDNTKCLVPPRGEEDIYAPAIASYNQVNKEQWQLQRKIEITIPYEFVSTASIQAFFDRKDVDLWGEFYAKYPDSGGIIAMSAVGFNPSKTIAIVYTSHSCRYNCGGGDIQILKKENGEWKQADANGPRCGWRS